MTPQVRMLIGAPAAGKSSIASTFEADGFAVLNRDKEGGKVIDLLPKMRALLTSGKNVLLDNTFPTVESRQPFIDAAKAMRVSIEASWLNTSIEDAQFNAAIRMMERVGRLIEPDEFKRHKDPNLFPVAVLFAYRKQFQPPTTTEGFDKIHPISFKRVIDETWTGKAAIFDYDGTLRVTKSGAKFPTNTDDIKILPGRREKILQCAKDGFKLFGISNQSGVSKGDLTAETCHACFDATNKMLGIDIQYRFCPHPPAPISCYCRKPQTGLFVELAFKHKLDPRQCIFVGDATTDKTFSQRCGMKFVHALDFFGQ